MQYGGIEKGLATVIERSMGEIFAERIVPAGLGTEFKAELEIPKDKSFGDLATNISMRMSRFAKMPPIELANMLKVKLDSCLPELSGAIHRVDVKQPGFVNF